MNKMSKKIFWILFSLLSLFLIITISIYNLNSYKDSFDKVKNSLNIMHRENEFNGPKPPEIIFADILVYSVRVIDNQIIITSHGNNKDVSYEIKKFASKIIDDEGIYIGNLYFDKYSYSIFDDGMTIVDNTSISKNLMDKLISSIIILIIGELVILYVIYKLTDWVCRPVIDAFNKQKDFIADASHELKTPLAVIMASAESLDKGKDKKIAQNILNESERMNKLIISLLDLAKSEYKNVQYSKVNLSKILLKSSLTFESVMFEKGIKLSYDIDEDVEFLCDADEMKQLFSILIDNAINHSLGEVYVSLKNFRNIEICVRNSGKEISKGDEEKIFERFYKSDKSRNRNSNRYGLGLAIAKNIVVKHAGKIIAYSKDGYTNFKITFRKN